MVAKMLTIFAIIFALGTEAKKLPLPPQHPYVMHVSLQFNEENITQFIAEAFFASNGLTAEPTAAQCNISLFDIVNAIPFKKMTDADLSSAFGSLGIVLEDDDIQMFMENMNYAELSNVGFSVSRMFKTFVKTYFTTGTTQLLSVLQAFNVGEEFTVAYAFGTDEEMFIALKEAEFSPDTIAEVEALLNTKFTIKDISNILGIKKFDSVYVQDFVNINITNFLVTKELQQVNFEAFLRALNFSLQEYKDMKSFKTCYKSLTQTKALAVAISPNEILTNDDTVLQNYLSLSAFTTLNIASVQDKKLTFTVVSHNTTGNGFTKFTVAGPIASYIGETTSYEDVATKACTYVTENIKNLVSQPAAVRMSTNQLAMAKLPGTTFKKASPIICDGKLFGLAATEDISSISFSVFEVMEQPEVIIAPTLPKVPVTEQPEIIITTILPDAPVTDLSQNPEVMAMVNELFQNFLLTFNPCNYMVCASTPAPDVSVASQQEVQEPELSEPEILQVEEELVPEQVGAENPKEPLPVEGELGNLIPAEPVPDIDQPAVLEQVVPDGEIQEPPTPNDLPEVVGALEEVQQIVVVQEPIIPVAEVQEPEVTQVPVEEQSQVDKEIQEPIISIAEVQEPKVSPGPGTEQPIVEHVVLESDVQEPSSPNDLAQVVGPKEEVQQTVAVQEPIITVAEVQEPEVSQVVVEQQTEVNHEIQEPINPVAEVQETKVSPAPAGEQPIVEHVILEGEVEAPLILNTLPAVVGPQEEVQQTVAVQEPIIPVAEVQEPEVLQVVVKEQTQVNQEMQKPIVPVAEVQEPEVPQVLAKEQNQGGEKIQEPVVQETVPDGIVPESLFEEALVEGQALPISDLQEVVLPESVQDSSVVAPELQGSVVVEEVVKADSLTEDVAQEVVMQDLAQVQEPKVQSVVEDQPQVDKEVHEPIIPVAEAQEPEVLQVVLGEQSQGVENMPEPAVQETVPEEVIPESLLEQAVVVQEVVVQDSVQKESLVPEQLVGESALQ